MTTDKPELERLEGPDSGFLTSRASGRCMHDIDVLTMTLTGAILKVKHVMRMK